MSLDDRSKKARQKERRLAGKQLEIGNRQTRLAFWGIVVASVAVVVAAVSGVVSYGLTARALEQALTHNRLSVRPRVWTYYMTNEEPGWRLQNSGVGPGEVRKFTVELGMPDGSWRELAGWRELFDRLGLEKWEGQTYRYTIPSAGVTYQAGSSRNLFKVFGPQNRKILDQNWRRVKIEVCFCSMYDECWLNTGESYFPEPSDTDECPAGVPSLFGRADDPFLRLDDPAQLREP